LVMLHEFLALLAGFAAMAVLVLGATALLRQLAPAWVGRTGKPEAGYAFVSLGYSFLSAAAGGYVTAWASDRNPLTHMLALAIAVLAIGALSAIETRGKQSIWYALALLVMMPMGVYLGGLVRLRVQGVL
jgi:hypothetical protein